ncbi:MarR family transcriptional regulator [Gordonia jinghuaiqii]|uniref:MarR family transcriptional regulator n=1 Tax=Gordonia jinghuaiqii TaxID=2758710 RepID=A0A7D7R5B9_9ACTN|nr:MarR family transcriptional regulator [Gordonia jinghuaiqii]MCR5976328.1 MarR family transcriptional regulator [Gordonia jinghuaiqii]QMT03547.1 MarR family transcriptional regulator [Gordonia jinghuaiqii]
MTSTQNTPDTITDPVDWARHYWEHQTLDGDEQRFLALTSLLRYQRIVADAVDSELKKHGLNMTDYLLLMTLQLSEHGTRLISSLARNLMVHATTATLATDRLEARKLLGRSPHPTDRRATCVTITAKGRDTVDSATRALTAIDFGMRGSSSTDVTRLRKALTAMRQSVGDA